MRSREKSLMWFGTPGAKEHAVDDIGSIDFSEIIIPAI